MLAAVERLKNQTEQQAEDDATRAFLDVMLVYSGGANDRVESGAAWRKSARVAQALLYLGAIALGPVPFLVSSDSRSQLAGAAVGLRSGPGSLLRQPNAAALKPASSQPGPVPAPLTGQAR